MRRGFRRLERGTSVMMIAPSVLACDFSRLGEESLKMEKAGADLLHLDVMDGHFVPNISFGAPVIKSLRPGLSIPFDVHLMISHPLTYIGDFLSAGADLITFHLEADSPIPDTIDAIRKGGAKPGLVLKPGTPAQAVFPYLEQVDMVLVMTVEPGFGGQSFMADMMPKVSAIRQEIDRRGLEVMLQVDGGIDDATGPVAAGAGANVFVAGSALFRQEDYAAGVSTLRERCRQGVQSR